jgi:hypothetical protein
MAAEDLDAKAEELEDRAATLRSDADELDRQALDTRATADRQRADEDAAQRDADSTLDAAA